MIIHRIIHKVRWYLDPWYRKRIKTWNRTMKQIFSPTIISGIYEESPLMKRLNSRQAEGDT